jgi:predicted DNA-binding protein (MmcQ/YjbR family)
VTPSEASAHLRAVGLALPGVHEDHPWGESVLKVDGKVFLFGGHAADPSTDLKFSLKLPHTGGDALLGGYAQPTGYGLGRSGWVSFRFPPDAVPDADALTAMMMESYRAVAKKRRIKELGV